MTWGSWKFAVAGLVIAGLLGVGVAGAAGAADGEGTVTLHVTGPETFAQTMQPGDDLHQVIDLTDVDGGVGRFELTLSVRNGSVATFETVRTTPDVQNFSVTVGPDNRTAILRGRYTGGVNDWGATSGLANASLRGDAPGETRIEVSDITVRDDDGDPYAVETSGGHLTVTDGPIANIAPAEERGVVEIDGEGTLTVHALEATADVGALRMNISMRDPADLDVARFVEASLADSPESGTVHVDGTGRFVRVNATGLDLDGPGDVPLMTVTVRGLSEDTFLLGYGHVRLRDTDGRRYVIDSSHLGNIDITAASDRPAPTPPTPTSTTHAPATTALAATTAPSTTSSHTTDSGTTSGAGTVQSTGEEPPTGSVASRTASGAIASPTTTDSPGGGTPTTGSDGPGFTLATALVGLFVVALLARRR